MKFPKTNIILLTGLSGSGKSTVARLLKELFGYHPINVGDMLRSYLLNLGIVCTSRSEIGPSFERYCSRRIIYQMLYLQSAIRGATVIDGVRLAITCRQFLFYYPGTQIWYIETEDGLRHKRLIHRGIEANIADKEGRISLECFDYYKTDDNEIRSMSSRFITNNSSFDELQTRINYLYCDPSVKTFFTLKKCRGGPIQNGLIRSPTIDFLRPTHILNPF